MLYTRGWGVPSATSRPCSVRDGDEASPDVGQARLLLGMADNDLGVLRVAGNPAEVSDESFGFHVQQAAEKGFKAWIALLGKEYPLTHELDLLIDMIRQQDAAVSQYANLAGFSAFAVKYRYDPLPENAARIDRPAAIREAEALLLRVRRLLPEAGSEAL